ncbi:putative flippase GtrA [Enterococcus sp. PF1-24]|uniref:GtrA family protein n=1 Tax=unclassified Enterococcus TaxID=2608891 RepID=UPI0024735493|nr:MULTISPECIES: GtrA family protein [unclassified Enterococcus]MDH6363615.1 putative flippase GtrA [Enterococcus sp. PFB1-1]MDH6400850.1 putative flippase GtrA [Enterococcus sp. PF1-24]
MKLLLAGKKKLEELGYWEAFSYLFFGGVTTVVNIAVFSLLHYTLTIDWMIANTVAWFISVLVAFITNKLWVFQTKSENLSHLLWEFVKFVFYRILSLGIDNGVMWLFIDKLGWSTFIVKILAQIVVVVANYAFSKLFIFKKE